MTTFHGRDDVLSLLTHLGYLGYEDEASEVYIPNKEVLVEFKTSTKSTEWNEVFRMFEISAENYMGRECGKGWRTGGKTHNQAGNRTTMTDRQ